MPPSADSIPLAAGISVEVLRQRARVLSQTVDADAHSAASLVQHPHLLFAVGEERLGVPLEKAREALARVVVTPVPGTPPAIAGVANLRGVILDVVKLDVLFGLAPPTSRTRSSTADRVLVMESRLRAVGLWVDAVIGIESIPPDAHEPAPDVAAPAMKDYLDAVARIGDDRQDVVALLDINRIFDSDQFASVREE